jgi:threonine dehydratase
MVWTSAAAAAAAGRRLCTAASAAAVDAKRGRALPAHDCVKFDHVAAAMLRIRSGVIRTSCWRSHWLSEVMGSNIFLKMEHQQFTGSFKERGARNALLALTEAQKRDGVVAASAGNHALALAWHGGQLGIPVTVVMPTVAPMAKVDKCRLFGAHVVIEGEHIGDARAHAVANHAHLTYINGYDDPAIIAGAGTLGVELLEQVPEVDVVVVPVGGAGLIAGVALAVKTLSPRTRVIGVEPNFCASYSAALAHGEPTPVAVRSTLADGLAVPTVGAHAFAVAQHWVDETVTVDERDIALSVLRLIEGEKMVVEGGGAAGLAALLPGCALDRADLKGKNVVVPLCGGNIDVTVLGRVIERGLAADKRLVRLTIPVSDRPGGIAELCGALAASGASVKDIFHERAWLQSAVDQVVIKAVLETRGAEHNKQLLKLLEREGYANYVITEAGDCEALSHDVR